MEDFGWIKDSIKDIEKSIASKRERLKLYRYDRETTDNINAEIFVLLNLAASVKRQLPSAKIKSDNKCKCPNCECVVNQYAKFCHYCGQRMSNEIVEQEGIKGWCADK